MTINLQTIVGSGMIMRNVQLQRKTTLKELVDDLTEAGSPVTKNTTGNTLCCNRLQHLRGPCSCTDPFKVCQLTFK